MTLNQNRKTMFTIRQILPLVLLCGSATFASAADPPTLAEIAAGIRKCNVEVHDLHMRLERQTQRTDIFYRWQDHNWQQEAQRGGQRTRRPKPDPREERHTFELREQLPRLAWSEFNADGSLASWSASDGAMMRQFHPDLVRYYRCYLQPETSAPSTPFLRPEFLLKFSETPLADLLDDPHSHAEIQSTREVGGEQLVDLVLAPSGSAVEDGKAITWQQRIRATINGSQQYWPVFVRTETAETKDAAPYHAQELEATGWIESGPLVYPQHLEQRVYYSIRPDKPPAGFVPQLELGLTQTIDILEAVANAGIADTEFAPAFPVGEVYYDSRARQYFQVDADSKSVPYVPVPRGLRGAVFVYHLCWLTALIGYVFLCKFRSPPAGDQ